MRRLVGTPTVSALLVDRGTPFPNHTGQRLGQLALLYGLPFDNLVADARMLAEESIRFFYVDQNWLDALIDGALSTVGLDEPHATTVALVTPRARAYARACARLERKRRRAIRRGEPRSDADFPHEAGTVADDPVVWSGFLLRSAAVSDWPGLQVRAFAGAETNVQLDLLRVDRIAPTVLMAIFNGSAARVELAMPSQLLHFGLKGTVGAPTVTLRGIGGKIEAGKQIEGVEVSVPLRNDPVRKIVDVAKLVGTLNAQLQAAYGSSTLPTLNPGAFAIEMVAGAAEQQFVISAAHAPAPTAAPAATTDAASLRASVVTILRELGHAR